jgi:hypothetical protein
MFSSGGCLNGMPYRDKEVVRCLCAFFRAPMTDKSYLLKKYIVKLKAADEIKRVLEEKQKQNKKT